MSALCKFVLFLGLLGGLSNLAYSQRHVVNRDYKPIRISKSKARIVCPIFEVSRYPYHGIGLKLGDPFTLTYKFYASKSLAFAVDGGKSASGLYNKYHRENFIRFISTDTLGIGQGIMYISHLVKSDWVLEGKILYHRDATKLLQGLQWYVGGGLQLRQTSLEYQYLLDVGFDENELGSFDVTSFTMGPTGIFGFEYAYFQVPISAFMEIEVYSDVLEDPGWLRFQGGIGLRYVF